MHLFLIMKVANCPWILLASSALCVAANGEGTHANACRAGILTTTTTTRALEECRQLLTIGKEAIDLVHPSKGLLLDLRSRKGITQSNVSLPINAAWPPATRALVIATGCALQIASTPTASCNRMARVEVVSTVVWTGSIVHTAKVSDLTSISGAFETSRDRDLWHLLTCASRAASPYSLLSTTPHSLLLRSADLSRGLNQPEIPLLRRIESTEAALVSELVDVLGSPCWTSVTGSESRGIPDGRARGSGEPLSIKASGSATSFSFGALRPASKTNLFEAMVLLCDSSLDPWLDFGPRLVRSRLSRICNGLEVVFSSGLGDFCEKGSCWNSGWCLMLGARRSQSQASGTGGKLLTSK